MRAPDTGSKKKFDVNRQLKESTGRFNYTSGKRERAVLKAGKTDIVPKVPRPFLRERGTEREREGERQTGR